MGPLAQLQSQGVRVSADGDRLMVEPRSALTEELRAFVRAHKSAILAELANAAPTVRFREALRLGRLHLCARCACFAPGADPAGLGQCQLFDVEAWPSVPFRCEAFLARGSGR